MKYLIHGDDTAASRNFLTSLTDGFNASSYDGKSLTVESLEETLLSSGLFGDKKAVVIENLLSKNTKKKEIIEWLNNWNGQELLVIWEDKKLPKTAFSKIKDIKVNEFSLPTFYFQFLDSFTPTQKKQVFDLYHELLKTYEPEQVFYSLLKRLRLLVVLSDNAVIDEISKMQEWQVSKLKNQVRFWPKDKLFSFYKKLQNTEISLKTGKLPVGLSKHLDILILSEL